MTITLRQMRYALAVARTGHFGQAAEECAVSQPALSQQILALETLCGSALFDRLKGRGQVWMTATEAALFDGIDGASHFHVQAGTITPAEPSP